MITYNKLFLEIRNCALSKLASLGANALVCCRGAVAVSMDIKMLDVNQCNGDYHTPNAFKRTHKCDERTSYVSDFLKKEN
jgi:hypothetical protein